MPPERRPSDPEASLPLTLARSARDFRNRGAKTNDRQGNLGVALPLTVYAAVLIYAHERRIVDIVGLVIVGVVGLIPLAFVGFYALIFAACALGDCL